MVSIAAVSSNTEAEELLTSETSNTPTSWSPEGVLAYTERGDIWLLPLEGDRKPRSFLATQFEERNAMFSPDGRWIAFTSNRSGRDEVYVKAYPGEGGLVPISTDGGTQPVWAPSGKELFYRNADRMMVVSVQAEPTFKPGRPGLLFEASSGQGVFGRGSSNYDISPDGQRFLMLKAAGQEEVIIVLNRFEKLKHLVTTE